MGESLGVSARQNRAQRRHPAAHALVAGPRPVPRLRFQHPAADRADDQCGLVPFDAAEPGVIERLDGGAEREGVRARTAGRGARRLWHLARDAAAEAVGIDEAQRANGAGARRQPGPVRFHTDAERAHGAEPGDDDAPHAVPSRPAMKRDRESKDAKWAVKSSDSSMTTPNFSSMAMDSS